MEPKRETFEGKGCINQLTEPQESHHMWHLNAPDIMCCSPILIYFCAYIICWKIIVDGAWNHGESIKWFCTGVLRP